MASPPRTREEERRLNARTLVIASAASATAAAVTSQLWIAGTWIAAALTPVLVAVVSELLHRPSEKIARAMTSDREALVLDEAAEPSAAPPAEGPYPDPAAPEPSRRRLEPQGEAAPVRVYRQPRSGPVRPRLAVGVIAATTAIAVVVAAVVLTVPELIAGQSIGRSDSATSLFGGPARNKKPATGERDEAPAPVRTEETSPPEQTATATTPEPETSPADDETVTTPPPPTTTPGTTAPAP